MAKSFNKSVNLVFKARDEASQKINKLAKGVKRGVNQSVAGLSSKINLTTAGVEGGIKALDAVFKGLNGDMGDALDVLETLPAGIGPIVAATRSLSESLGIVLRTTKQINESNTKWAKNLEEAKKEAAAFGDPVAQARLKRERELTAHFMSIFEEFNERREELGRNLTKLEMKEMSIAHDLRHDLLNQQLNAEIQAVKDQLAAEKKAAEEAAKARVEAEVKAQKAVEKARIDSMKRAISAVAREQQEANREWEDGQNQRAEAESRTAQARLDALMEAAKFQGKDTAGLEKQAIDLAFKSRIEAAKTDAERTFLQIQRDLKKLGIDKASKDKAAKEAKKAADEARRTQSLSPTVTAQSRGFLALAAQQKGGVDIQKQMARDVKETKKSTADSAAALKDIARGINEGTVVLANVRLN